MDHLPANSNATHERGRATVRRAGAALVTVTLGLAAVAGVAALLHTPPGRPDDPPPATAPAVARDASRFILNTLLVPALDADAVPLRWVDPRSALRCGPGTAVLVNREPLAAGALVPDTSFELEWLADGCRPLGADGPRLDGRIRMTVFREDWGFSAMIESQGFRITSRQHTVALVSPCGASIARDAAADEPALLTSVQGIRRLPCR